MARPGPEILESLRLPALYAAVLRYAGVPDPPGSAADRFAVRSGPEPPGVLAGLLAEAVLDDAAEAAGPDAPAGRLAVEGGFGSPCPDAFGLWQAASPEGGAALVFAVERRDAAGRLVAVTWAAVPEEEPAPERPFRAAVLREEVGGGMCAG